MTAHRQSGTGGARDYERRDVAPRKVVYAVVGLFAGIALSIGIVVAVIALVDDGAPPARWALVATDRAPSAPRLQNAPSADRAAIEAAARERISGYRWIDRAAGRAAIPIERAMALMAARGWPDSPGGPPPPAAHADPDATEGPATEAPVTNRPASEGSRP